MKYTLDWLTNPEVFAVNRIAAHSDHRIYANHFEADADNSSLIQNLNGTWKFLYDDDFRNLPAGATDPATDISSWAEIKVPGNWEFQGFGTALYVNHPFEFATSNPVPPTLPEVIPGGIYRRDFGCRPIGKDATYTFTLPASSRVFTSM